MRCEVINGQRKYEGMMCVCSPKAHVQIPVTFTLFQKALLLEHMLEQVPPAMEHSEEEKNSQKEGGNILLPVSRVLVYLTILPLMEECYRIRLHGVEESLDELIEIWLFRYELGLLCHF